MSISAILNDPKLREEIMNQLGNKKIQEKFHYDLDEARDLLSNWRTEIRFSKKVPKDLETIVKLMGRPVLQIIHNSFSIPLSETWYTKLNSYRNQIENAIPSVGRIELREHPTYSWVGTGWLVEKNIIVTNRHVAKIFAEKDGEGSQFTFSHNIINNRQIQARIDFREEYQVPEQFEFNLDKVLYIEEDGDKNPDIAFLQVSLQSSSEGKLPSPIGLVEEKLNSSRDVAVIGYPARDDRVCVIEDMERIFDSIYDVKRLSPGIVRPADPADSELDWLLTHDCTTLGGNSGSVVLDIETGKAIGLHYGGNCLKENYAVSSNMIAQRLNKIL